MPQVANARFGFDNGVTHFAAHSGFIGPILAPKQNGPYVCDTSLSGPTDTLNRFTGDANAFDGSTSTSASSNGLSGNLESEGTDAPTTGDEIAFIRFRAFTNADGDGASWKPWVYIKENRDTDAPWTWQNIADLEVWADWFSVTNEARVRVMVGAGLIAGTHSEDGVTTSWLIYRIEVEVFTEAGDDLYVVAEDTGTVDKVGVFKSTNGGSSWVRQDTGSAPILDNGFLTCAAVIDGTLLHIATISDVIVGMDNSVEVEYHTFDTLDDTWQIVEENVVTEQANGSANFVDIAVRSDGDVIILHTVNFTSMGSDFGNVGYSVRQGTTWTTSVAIDSENLNHDGVGCVIAPDDECHLAYQNGDLWALTLDSANNTSTRVSVHGTAWKPSRPITWDNGGTQQILVVGRGFVERMKEDGSGDIAVDLAHTEPGDVTAEGFHAGVAWDSAEGEAYFAFTNTDDLYYDKGLQGTDWGTDVFVAAAGGDTPDRVWANVYTRAGGTKLGILWAENRSGFGDDRVWFEEVDIAVAPPGPAFPPFLHRPPRHVRM